MKTRLLCYISVAAIAAGVSACAGSRPLTSNTQAAAPDAQSASLPGKPGCFSIDEVSDWTILNDAQLIVHAPTQQDAYLVQLGQPVIDINMHKQLGWEVPDRSGKVCDGSRDNVIVEYNSPPRVAIQAVHQLTMPEQAALVSQAGTRVATIRPEHVNPGPQQ